MDRIFSLPDTWGAEERYQYNIEQYKKYITSMNAVAESHDISAAFFLQPVPAIGKGLTDEERNVVGDLSYGAIYQRMTDDLLSLRDDGVPIHSLLNAFADIRESVYGDSIHCVQAGERSESLGYEILATAVAEVLEKEWDLVPSKSLSPQPAVMRSRPERVDPLMPENRHTAPREFRRADASTRAGRESL
jgi:hypothetical protein